MVEIGLHGLSRVHADGTRAVANLNLRVGSGEFLVLAGPTGCGKTTTLRLIAGLDEPTAGVVTIDGRSMNEIPTRDRDVALVTQDASLYPHLDVEGNLAFALRTRRLAAKEVTQRVEAESRALGLRKLLRHHPNRLSAGHRQKAALGRATARLPRVLLLDEPLGRLAPNERARVRTDLRRIHDGLGATTVYVTHDQSEAMALGDRIALLDHGTLQQVGPPLELYRRPRNLFAATFLGTPPMAILEARVTLHGGYNWLDVGAQRIRLPRAHRRRLDPYVGRRVFAGVRSEHVRGATDADTGDEHRRLRLNVHRVEHLGSMTLVSGTPVGTRHPTDGSRHPGVVTARLPAFSKVMAEDVLPVEVDIAGVHFFDPLTGLAVSDTIS